MSNQPVAQSSMAKAFNADISLALPEQALFIVEGRGGPPDAAIASVGGKIVIRVANRTRVFATMTPTAFLGLRGHRAIAFIGAVSLDQERFNQVVSALQV